jgi:recombinational DNA repair protein (RecF pathway)
MQDYMLFDLDLKDKISQDKDFAIFRELYDLLNNESVQDSLTILEAISQIIDKYQNDYWSAKKLKDLKSIEEVNKDLA